ncbi:MAG: DUF456 family protein [Elainella sp. Prado103]|jgi:hypothetical protein|nr:DUF456 family protein [Elainella sp. Prado103]
MVLLYGLLVVVMIVGVIGAVVPSLPGVILILAAILIWGAVNGFAGLGIPLLVTIGVLAVNTGVELLATYLGAKQAGASAWGQIGAIVGLLLGVFGLLPALPIGGPLLGLLIGPLLGAIIGEYLYRRDLKLAIRAGFGIIIGTLIGSLIQGLLAAVALAVFLLTTWPQVMG